MDYIFAHHLPGIDSAMLDQWLGQRVWLVHRAHYETTQNWLSIVSSSIERKKAEYHNWPAALTCALQIAWQHQQTCLIAPGTTTAPWLSAAAGLCQVQTLTIELSQCGSVDQWIQQTTHQLSLQPGLFRHRLCGSPPLTEASAELKQQPLQDRAAVALGHNILAIQLRPSGKLDQLLQVRLNDQRFPHGTVQIRVNPSSTEPRWPQPNAVGWYLPHAAQFGPNRPTHLPVCRKRLSAPAFTFQWTAPISLIGRCEEYFVHCVRGQQGRHEYGGNRQAILDALLGGCFHEGSAFQTLLKIIASGRLRASNKLSRGDTRLISFSAVPLAELLARRRFQSHLGRWDWEPYGIMIRRDTLQAMGLRQVVYGDERAYQQLPEGDRPYYQPSQRRTVRRADEHWEAEREWRLAGDVRLCELTASDALLFVEYEHQAAVLARESNWPVIWLRRIETQLPPTASVRQKHTPYRIDRN